MNGMQKKMTRASLIVFLVGLLLASCAVGPEYQRPQMDLPTDYKESGRWKTAQPEDESPRGPWWTIFADKDLDRLMEILDRQNFSIEQAEAQFRQSQALLREARAGLSPTLSPTASATHGVSTPGANIGNQYSLGVSAGWEMDIWGSVRRAIEAGEAKQAASASQIAAVRLSSQGQLAGAYLQLRVADRQLEQLQASEETLRQTLTITGNQYAAGIVSQASVALAESQLKAAQAQRLQKQLGREQLEQIARSIATEEGATPLMQAAYFGQLKIVKYLIRRKVDVNERDPKGATALFYATQGNHLDVVEWLIKKGADPMIRQNTGQTAADIATERRYEDVALFLEKTIKKRSIASHL